MAKAKSKSKSKYQQSKNQSKNVKTVNEKPNEPQEELSRDFLDDFLFHAANYLYVRRKIFITIGIIIAVVLIGSYGAYRYFDYRETVRNEKLFQIETIINNNDLSDKQKQQQAIPLLDQFINTFEGTEQDVLALFYRGNIYYRTGAYEKSEADFKTALENTEKKSDLHLLASIYLANVYREQKKLDEAIKVLEAAKREKVNDVLLMELSETYYSAGKGDEARQMLQILLKDYPKSQYISRAKMLLDLL